MVGGSGQVGIKDFLRIAEEFEPELTAQLQSKLEITDSMTVDEVADKFLVEIYTRKPSTQDEDEDQGEDGAY